MNFQTLCYKIRIFYYKKEKKMNTVANLFLDSHIYCVEEAINYINNFVSTSAVKNLSIDISKFNFIEAANICVLSSTFSFNKNPQNKINWIVNSADTEKTINKLKLKNISLEVKAPVKYSEMMCG